MLTREMLAANTALTGLTEAQIVAITQMSMNDENTVIGTKIGALHGQYDADVLGITGIAKNGTEKSYDYVKRVLSEYKTKVESANAIQTQLDKAKADVAKLTKQIADGEGNEAIKQQLKDSKNQVTQLQSQLTAKDKELTDQKTKYESQIKSTHVDYAFAAATSGIKFKTGITDAVQKVLVQSAKAEVLAKGTPDFIDDGQGGKKLVFRGTDGNVLNNPNNNLNPYTAEELLMETSIKDVIETGKQQLGSGTKPLGGQGVGNGLTIDLTGIKNQVEADKAIEAYLLANGLTRDSAEFAEQSMQIRNDNNISNLPIR